MLKQSIFTGKRQVLLDKKVVYEESKVLLFYLVI